MTITRKFWWITGFTQADGAFVVSFQKRIQGKMPFRPSPAFVLTQSIREVEMITDLHQQMKVGNLSIYKSTVNITVRRMDELLNVVIPHFDQYPLRGGKYISYLIFKTVVHAIYNQIHNNPAGFLRILDLCYFTHDTSLRSLEMKYSIIQTIADKFGSTPYTKLNIDFDNQIRTIDKNYVAGVIDGDGSVNFTFSSERLRVRAGFTVIADIHDYNILLNLVTYFKTGKVYNLRSPRYQVENVTSLIENIRPFLESVQLHTVKKEYLAPTFEA